MSRGRKFLVLVRGGERRVVQEGTHYETEHRAAGWTDEQVEPVPVKKATKKRVTKKKG